MDERTYEVASIRNAIFADVIDDDAACAVLGIGSATLGRYIADGMPYFKLGRRRLYDVAELREWVLSHRQNAPARRPGRPRKASA